MIHLPPKFVNSRLLKITVFISVVLFAIVSSSFAQQVDTLRICTYNLLNFPGNTGERVIDFEYVLDEINPHLLVCQEVVSTTGADDFLDDALGDLLWDRSSPTGIGSSDEFLFYRSDIFELVSTTSIITDLRNVEVYELLYLSAPGTPPIYLANTHLKASQGTDNEQRRLSEVNDFLDYLSDNGLENSDVIFCGDFNFYDSNEPGYQALLENDLFIDPIDTPGDWHDNAAFADVHTQSTRTAQFGGGATGGMDDRFDFIMLTDQFYDGLTWEYLDNSYVSYGNDGEHLNDAINEGINEVVSAEMADALHNASDHIPVYMDLLCVYNPVGDLTLTATPWEDPILIGPQGGSFRWDAVVENPSAVPVFFDAWTSLELPNGSEFGPLDVFYNIGLLPGAVLEVSPQQVVPGIAPYGLYTYFARVGDYDAGEILAEDSFEFVKQIVDVADNSSSQYTAWESTGWFEFGANDNEDVYADYLPSSPEIVSAFPNPFNSTTTITVGLPISSFVRLDVYNVLGQNVATVVQGSYDKGFHEFTFQAEGLANGIYFMTLDVNNYEPQLFKVIFIK